MELNATYVEGGKLGTVQMNAPWMADMHGGKPVYQTGYGADECPMDGKVLCSKSVSIQMDTTCMRGVMCITLGALLLHVIKIISIT
jgi:hypothetical protein